MKASRLPPLLLLSLFQGSFDGIDQLRRLANHHRCHCHLNQAKPASETPCLRLSICQARQSRRRCLRLLGPEGACGSLLQVVYRTRLHALCTRRFLRPLESQVPEQTIVGVSVSTRGIRAQSQDR